MKAWRTEILGEIVKAGGGRIQTGPFGSQLHAHDYVDEGIPCIMPANMKDNRVDGTGIARITPEDANRLHRHIVKKGDIVYSRRGDVTQKALISENEDGFFCGTGCLLLRPGSEIDSAFLTYYLSTKTYQSWIVGQAVGATMPNLNTGILNGVSFCAPEKTDQQKIAKVLSTLDAKIELNNRINAELEAMAKLLYDYWFVQFDFPMTAAQANALGQPQLAGQPYKTSGGKMVFNKTLKREIPEGWEDGALGSVCSMTRGVTYNKDDVRSNLDPSVTPILRATNVTGSTIDTNDMVNIPEDLVTEKQLMSKDDILIVMSSGSKNHIGKNAPYYFEHKVAFGAFCSKITPKPSHRCFVKTSMQSQHFKGHIRNVCLGTNINNLTTSHISGYLTVVPVKEVLMKFEQALQSSCEMIGNNQKQNQELTELRDWLLPMLMNGQVTVK